MSSAAIITQHAKRSMHEDNKRYPKRNIEIKTSINDLLIPTDWSLIFFMQLIFTRITLQIKQEIGTKCQKSTHRT